MWIRHCAVALLVLSGCTGGAGPDQQAGQGPMAGGPDTGTEPVEKLLPPPPGPAFLYEDAPLAPPFQNVGVWQADPLYVMGASAYTQGEYVYQGFIFDDFGAATGDPTTRPHTGAALYRSGGSLHYPTDTATYAFNAADLLEFRVRKDGDQLKYRLTLNTMIAPDVTAIAIGIDTDGDASTGTHDWGYGIGELGALGLDHIIVTWGTGAELSSACSGCAEGQAITTSVDLDRNQIELTVPLSPGMETWRHYLVTGLYDSAANAFKAIQESADAVNPGGAFLQNPPPVFDVGFRRHDQEPWGRLLDLEPTAVVDNLEDFQQYQSPDWGYWREANQSQSLAERDISSFYADIDFAKLELGEDDFSAVPRSGVINGLYGSRFDFGEGVLEDAPVVTAGRVQPYMLYIPTSFSADEPTPLFLQMHGGSSPHNQILGAPNFLLEFGEKRDALVLAALARGPSNGFSNESELDVLEALSHVDTQYNVDYSRMMVGGPSMGGTGTFNFAGRYPDLFIGAFSIVSGTSSDQLVDNFRHVPLLIWNGAIDELVIPQVGGVGAHRRMLDRGYRNEFGLFPAYDHTRHFIEDEWGAAREYLDSFVPPPAYPWYVTYHSDPAAANPQWGLTHDRAYWLTDIVVASDAATGKVDARDLAAGQASPSTRTYQEYRDDPDLHLASGLIWLDSVFVPDARNRLQLDLDGVASVTVWLDATQLDVSAPIEIESRSTHEAVVTLVSHAGTKELQIPAAPSTQLVELR